MNDRLKQLKRQKEILTEHLEWIDQEISREQQSHSEEDQTATEIDQLPKFPLPGTGLSSQPESPDVPRIEHSAPSSNTIDDIAQPSARDFQSASTPEISPRGLQNSQRIGCILIGVLVTAVALFAVWILPSLIYD